MRAFPFPDQVESRDELKRDILFPKIPSDKIVQISDQAWNVGVSAAQKILSRYPEMDIRQILKAEGLTVSPIHKDNVVGSVRYFSEYYSGKKQIFLYIDSIRMWAEANGLAQADAEDLILAHEMFHYLECTSLGLTSNLYQVPVVKIGKVAIGKSGIRALSEIGAHGFSRSFYEGRIVTMHLSDNPLYNCAMNEAVCENRYRASKIYKDNKVLRFFSGTR